MARALPTAMNTSSLKSSTTECRKFAPNIFNKSKCQNCFRTKDAHSAEALESNRVSQASSFFLSRNFLARLGVCFVFAYAKVLMFGRENKVLRRERVRLTLALWTIADRLPYTRQRCKQPSRTAAFRCYRLRLCGGGDFFYVCFVFPRLRPPAAAAAWSVVLFSS